MKAFVLASVLFLGAVSQSEAVLPPLYSGVAEIKGMLSSPDLGKVLQSGEVIMSIIKTESGYRITTNKHIVDVTVTARHQKMPGPAVYDFSFGAAQEPN